MAMSDCSKCWETPCVCGHEYDRSKINTIVKGWMDNPENNMKLDKAPVAVGTFNAPDCIDYMLAAKRLHELAGKCQVSYSLHYSEGSNQWNGDIRSTADGESESTRDYMLSSVMGLMIDHLLRVEACNH